MEAQVRTREIGVVHTPCKNMEAVFEQEYEKGEISGIFLMSNFPAKVIEEYTETVKLREASLPLQDEE